MIFYFSATGNSRWAAIQLATKLQEHLVNITDALQGNCSYTLQNEEPIGLVFPVHGWRPPHIIAEFISKLKIKKTDTNHPYCFVLMSAGDNIGLTLNYLKQMIYKNSSLHALEIEKIDAVFNILMPETYVGLPGMNIDTSEKEKNKIAEAQKQLIKITQLIYKGYQGEYKLIKGSSPWILSKILGGLFAHALIKDNFFHVEINKCIRCGICVNVCPVQDISGGYGKFPEWRHNGRCLTCFACYHHCPRHAIEWGWMTQHKGQYYFK